VSVRESRSELERLLDVARTLAGDADAFERLLRAFGERDVTGFRATLGQYPWNRPFETVCIDIVNYVCVIRRQLVCRRRKRLANLICTLEVSRDCRWWSRTLCFGRGPGVVDPLQGGR